MQHRNGEGKVGGDYEIYPWYIKHYLLTSCVSGQTSNALKSLIISECDQNSSCAFHFDNVSNKVEWGDIDISMPALILAHVPYPSSTRLSVASYSSEAWDLAPLSRGIKALIIIHRQLRGASFHMSEMAIEDWVDLCFKYHILWGLEVMPVA